MALEKVAPDSSQDDALENALRLPNHKPLADDVSRDKELEKASQPLGRDEHTNATFDHASGVVQPDVAIGNEQTRFEKQHLSGLRLVMIITPLSMIGFLILLDMSVIVTASSCSPSQSYGADFSNPGCSGNHHSIQFIT
jgi:hypothetical protein